MSVTAAVRSFVDLRSFAACVRPEAGDFATAREALPLADGPVTVAVLAPMGEGRVDGLPADDFVIVLTGSLTIGGTAVPAGRSIVIPAGVGFDWRAERGTVAIVMSCDSGPAGAHAPVAIDEQAPLDASGAPLAALLVGPTPACRNHTDYRSANGEFVCGTWDSTPYHRLPMRYRHYELMHLLDGSVTFVDEAGRRATFSAGDVFLVEQGAECSWESSVPVKKVYAIYRPA